jgi:hypothetical protein
MASIATKVAGKPIIPPCFSSQKVGVVVSAGKMSKAVRVRVAEQEWNKKFRKVCWPEDRTFDHAGADDEIALPSPQDIYSPRP